MSCLVKLTSYWDLLPLEIQVYIIHLADRAHHRDQLRRVREVMQHYWRICDCGPSGVRRVTIASLGRTTRKRMT